jgi:hypothetical protein
MPELIEKLKPIVAVKRQQVQSEENPEKSKEEEGGEEEEGAGSEGERAGTSTKEEGTKLLSPYKRRVPKQQNPNFTGTTEHRDPSSMKSSPERPEGQAHRGGSKKRKSKSKKSKHPLYNKTSKRKRI